MLVETIARPPSLVEKVCQQLAGLARQDQREDDGWLPTERELSTRLGVSRSVVREAVKRLEMQGLLEIRQGIGIRVVDMLHKPLTSALELLVPEQEERLRQLVEIRFMVEPENARLAAARATVAQIRALRAAHRRLVEAGNPAAAVLADLEFHRGIATASGNQIAGLLLISLSDLLQASLALGYRTVTTESAIQEHAVILRAVARRDPAAAARAMRKHIFTTRGELGFPEQQRKKKAGTK